MSSAAFQDALRTQDLPRLEALLHEHPDLLQAHLPNNQLPLHYAAGVRKYDSLLLLLRHGAPLDDPSSVFLARAMAGAARTRRLDVLTALLDAGCAVDAYAGGRTALLVAAYYGHADVIALLAERGADVEVRTQSGQTALCMAVRHGEAVQALLDAGATVDAVTDASGDTALLVAARKGACQTIELLVRAGAEVNHANTNGETALVLMAGRASFRATRALEVLLEAGALVNARGPGRVTALMRAAEYGREENVHVLLDRGALSSLRSEDGMTAAQLAQHAQHGFYRDIIQTLHECEARESAEVVFVGLRVGGPGGAENSLQRFERHALFDKNLLGLVMEFLTGLQSGFLH